MKLNTYPKCAYSFSKFLILNENLAKKFNEKIPNVKPFDVTLRDGLQSLNSNEAGLFTTNHKINLYNHLLNHYQLTDLEIGSFVNTKILPIFEDTEKIFKHVENHKSCYNIPVCFYFDKMN